MLASVSNLPSIGPCSALWTSGGLFHFWNGLEYGCCCVETLIYPGLKCLACKKQNQPVIVAASTSEFCFTGRRS